MCVFLFAVSGSMKILCLGLDNRRLHGLSSKVLWCRLQCVSSGKGILLKVKSAGYFIVALLAL